MLPSQQEFEDLLNNLKEQKTESPTVDAKADLSLDEEGDKAYFIRHMAALANNVEPSYWIIGVENQTWDLIGLDPNSPLRNADTTQKRMNDVLANRLDPNLYIRYCTYEVNGIMYGLVAPQSTQAPYIVSISNQEYGGNRTDAAPHHIYRGAIYYRHGANSLIANRQSVLLGIIQKAQDSTTNNDQPDEFLVAHNYTDVESENFGRHSLSEKLVECDTSLPSGQFLPAKSWISYVFCPVNKNLQIDTVELKDSLKPDQRIGRGSQWYRQLPNELNKMLYQPQATPHEFLGQGGVDRRTNSSQLAQFIRIRPTGHIETAWSWNVFITDKNIRCFTFVGLIGYLWQMMYFAQTFYQNASYYGTVSVLVNLIGTENTILDDYADGWLPLDHPLYRGQSTMCQYPNIQIEKKIALANSTDDDIETVIRQIAKDLGTYYNQDPPRCFDRLTEEFPHRQYMNNFCRF